MAGAGGRELAGDVASLARGRVGEPGRGASRCGCRPGALCRSRDRRARARRRSAAPARAGRGSRPRPPRAVRRAGAAAGASPAGRGSRRRRRRASAAARASRSGGGRRRARSAPSRPGTGSGSSRSAASRPTRPSRPWRTGRARGSSSPNVTAPNRLPRRVARWPTAIATPSATSALRRSAVPKRIDGEVSSTSQVTSTRSAMVHPHVRLAGPRGHVPVDPPDVVAGDVGADEGELGAVAEHRRAVVACELPFHAAPDRDVERAQEAVRDRPRPGPRRRGGRCDRWSHAALVSARSSCGIGTAARTRSRIVSGVTSSASAWYESTRRWRRASAASACMSSRTT